MPHLSILEPRTEVVAALATALDRVDVGIMLLDPSLRVMFVNQRLIDMMKLPAALLAGQPDFADIMVHVARSVWDNLPDEVRGTFMQERVGGVRAGSVPPTYVPLADGRYFRFRCDACPDGGRVLTYLEVSHEMRLGADDAMQRVSAELRFNNEMLEEQGAHLAELAEAAEASAQQAEIARQMLEAEIEERRALEDQLRLMATTDGLTGALNRSAFMAAGEREILLSRRSGGPLAVLMLDADHFKSINDRYGHAGGDVTLRFLADACRASVRATDWVGRLGGEEFALALPGADAARAAAVAEALRTRVAEASLAHGGQVIRVTVSIGVAVLGPGEATMEQVIARADDALYQAKRGGRDRVVLAEAA
jgi:diguanylate cyclase (GGDEF)-like protein